MAATTEVRLTPQQERELAQIEREVVQRAKESDILIARVREYMGRRRGE